MRPGHAGNGVVIKMDLNRAALKADARRRAAGYRPSPILAALIVFALGLLISTLSSYLMGGDRLTTALTSQGWENLSLSQLNEMIDVDSLARYYLMNEYVLNGESFFTSFFWYQDGASDVLHVGPLWDFDTCMGNKNEKVTDYNASSTSVLMKKMLNIPAFYQRVQELYARYKPLLTGMAGQVDGLRDEIGVSADLNYLRWSTLGLSLIHI